MKHLYQIALLLFAVLNTASAQVAFTKGYYNNNNEDFLAGIQCSDEGYIICGRTQNNSMDAWLLRLNKYGDTLWSRSYSTVNTDYLTGITECPDGGFISVGQVSQPGQAAIIFKVDAGGNLVWQKFYDSAQGVTVHTTPDGGYALCGALNATWILKGKGDAVGTVQWSKRYANVGMDRGYRFVRTNDGGYVVAIESIQATGNHSYQMGALKVDSAGTLQWMKSFGGDFMDNAWGVEQTADGGYVFAGYTNADALDGQGDYDIMLVKLSATGTIVWKKIYSNTYGTNDQAYNMTKTADGNLVIAGITKLNDNIDHLFIAKLDTAGNIMWNIAPDGFTGSANVLVPTADGGLCFSGIKTVGGVRKNYIIKTDADGKGCSTNNPFTLTEVSTITFFEQSAPSNLAGPNTYTWNLTPATRLPSIDGDVCDSAIVVPTVIAENLSLQQLLVYPNPAEHNLTVETMVQQPGSISTTICNALGQVVFSYTEKTPGGVYKKTLTVDAAPGIYFLSLQTAQGRVTKKIEFR